MVEPASKTIPDAITDILASQYQPCSAQEIYANLPDTTSLRTLQYHLKQLVNQGLIVAEGKSRSTKYALANRAASSTADNQVRESDDDGLSLSTDALKVKAYIRQNLIKRKTVGYHHAFLDQYRPNVSFYLSPAEREHLHKIGKPSTAPQPAGTYARHILNRLLIDLSWNSSRLEGNTYSLLDTRRLIDFGQVAEGRNQLEAQMILNHKDAIEFLVSAADDIGFNRYTILNLHAMLANNLLVNPAAVGTLRRIAVGIEQSAFLPLEVPQLIEEYFDQILQTAAAINDPFEQSLFMMVQLPYLQPFDDVNKRVSRLAANIPLITNNYSPLSFIRVPNDVYIEAMLGVYELNDTSLLKEVFIWAYEQSAERYKAVKQSLGEPDPLRLRYRDALKQVIATVIKEAMTREQAVSFIHKMALEHATANETEAFQNMVEEELVSLHEGNFARYRVTPSEFKAWQLVW